MNNKKVNLTDKVAQSIVNQAKRENDNHQKQISFMDGVFKSLFVIFPAWQTSLKTDNQVTEVKSQWIKSFIENSISSQELIETGFKGARASKVPFFPTCGQFVQWCRPEDENKKADKGYCKPAGIHVPINSGVVFIKHGTVRGAKEQNKKQMEIMREMMK